MKEYEELQKELGNIEKIYNFEDKNRKKNLRKKL